MSTKKNETSCLMNEDVILERAYKKYIHLSHLVFENNVHEKCYCGCGGGGWHSDWTFELGLSRDEVQRCLNTILAFCEGVYGSKPSTTHIYDEGDTLGYIYYWEYDLYYYCLTCYYTFDVDENECEKRGLNECNFELSVTWGRND